MSRFSINNDFKSGPFLTQNFCLTSKDLEYSALVIVSTFAFFWLVLWCYNFLSLKDPIQKKKSHIGLAQHEVSK